MSVYSIILCGGVGARLWPESTITNPKPFIDLIGDRSLFQRTVVRMATVSPGRPPVIVTGRAYVDQVRRQLAAIGSDGFIIAEPEGRDSGPALLAAAVWIARNEPGALAVAVASDHHIPDDVAFAEAVKVSVGAADAGEIVTFGVKPGYPSTSYGYIRPAALLDGHSALARVGQFEEKPNLARAEALVSDGCLWNTGNFMFRAGSLLSEAANHAPEMLAAVEAAVVSATESGGLCELGEGFIGAPKVSIDVAVMEKTRRAAVLPIDYAWSDLGSWDSVWSFSNLDEARNAVTGAVVMRDSEGCLVRAGPGVKVVAIGVRDLAVVVSGGNVLVSDLARVASLKPALDALKSLSAHGDDPAQARSADGLLDGAERLKAWLWEKALPVWWCFGADHVRGGFRESLWQDLRPTEATRRARVQARQIHVYATAGAMGWPGPWSAAVDHGLDYLLGRYRRPDGLFRGAVDPDGEPVDESAALYDQAFVLLALASAAKTIPERSAEFRAIAEDLAVRIRRTFGREGGGFRADDASEAYLANPIMHLFEAVLAWIEVTDDQLWFDWAKEIASLFLGRMWEPREGRIVEVFDEHWRPFPGPEGQVVEPGHQFEWAWLMERWGTMAHVIEASDVARALYASGEAGVDARSGRVLDALLVDGSVHRSSSRLWPQTERLKAALLLESVSGGPESDPFASACSALAALESYLNTPVAGLWRDSPDSTGKAAGGPAPASSFYHILGAISALMDRV